MTKNKDKWVNQLRHSFRANAKFRKMKSPSLPPVTERYGKDAGANRRFADENIRDNIKSTQENLDAARLALRPDLTPPPGVSLDEYRNQLRKERRLRSGGNPYVRKLSKTAIGKAISQGMARSKKWAAHKRKRASR